MTKKKKIIFSILAVFASLLIVGVITTCVVVSNNTKHFSPPDGNNHPNYKNTLTNKIVLDNFTTSGEWTNKTFISAEDINAKGYDSIENNAFDNIPISLQYVELPSIPLLKEDVAIHWNNVQQIKIVNNNEYWTINHHFVFYKNNVITIDDRINAYNLSFESINSYAHTNNKTISIADNFYNENIFTNITEIDINTNSPSLIFFYGENSFLNCNKLKGGLNLIELVYFSEKSFMNSSVEFVNISTSIDINIATIISSYAFANCSNLRSLNIQCENSYSIIIENAAFYNCENLTDISIANWVSYLSYLTIGNSAFACDDTKNTISRAVYIWTYNNVSVSLGDNIFAANYNQINLSLDLPSSFNSSTSAFSNINVDIENFMCEIDRDSKENYANIGFSQEQFDKIVAYIFNTNFNLVSKN